MGTSLGPCGHEMKIRGITISTNPIPCTGASGTPFQPITFHQISRRHASMARSDRSRDRHAHRSRRSRSRSAPRTHRSSRHHSSKRRRLVRSTSRERSRRPHGPTRRARRPRSRSSSRSKHGPKRRKRESDDKKASSRRHARRRRSSSRSASVLKSKRQEEARGHEKETKASLDAASSLKPNETVKDEEKDPKVAEDQRIRESSVDSERTVETSRENKVDATHPAGDVTCRDEQEGPTQRTKEDSVPKPVVDVSAIQKDILKALADARSTIAVIKKKGTERPLAVAPCSSRDDTNDATLSSPTKHVPEVVHVPPKTTRASPPRGESTTTDELDMFSIAALDDHDGAMNTSSGMTTITRVDDVSLQSNCDDAEGYYSATIGEILNGKYRVHGTVGKGVFSTVVRCQCLSPVETREGRALSVVAIKMIRNNDVMREAAQTELKILNELHERDPRDKKHVIRLVDAFSHRQHTALVFEPMQMNVREAMKKFGGKSGISIQAVRVFSKHLLIALNHLDQCDVIHADIKPDNILLDEKQTTIKLCDFGSAFKTDQGKQDPTPYLVSRFYRAPEIVLGLAYEKAVDMWSVGCCLYEMFTGKVMFPGSTNNEMLKLFMELKGKLPNKLIKKHRLVYIDQLVMEPHFTEDLKFCSRESDRVTGKPVLRLFETLKITNDLASNLLAAKSATDDRKLVLELRNLLDRMFTLDPSKRISVKDALAHPFVKG
ncbi:hypothetical protein PsorP6_015804 [Peronosclerospora sorghi]|uniref:Uncharacterized protein n=1 Tax=Peronosclerospora sorghi TaxID=230839 RepID=A0ACC0WQZ3_9STRA|nr:hypothetical protein PsorP6_015804 [Peronosclerospora sorghi]